MATATAAAPTLTPGTQTSEFSLAKLAGFAGVGMIAGSILLAALHPLPDVTAPLLHYGLILLAGAPVVYGGFRTFLKYAQLAKGYEPMINAAAAMVPGPLGLEVQHWLPLAEKVLDAALAAGQTSATPTPAPAAIAAAVATPVAPPSSPAAPSAA